MVHEYRKLSQTFEEIKAENRCLKNSSVEPSTAQLGDSDSLQTELSKLKLENDLLRTKSYELSSENERLSQVMSSWTKSSVSLGKLHETQKPLDDKSGLGFSFGESISEGMSTRSDLPGDKFKKMNFFKASVIHDVCESVKYNDQISQQLNHKGKSCIGYTIPEKSKPIRLTNRLEKDKAKAGPKSSVPNQQRRGSTKAKSVWLGQLHDQLSNHDNLKTHTGKQHQPQRDTGSNPSTESSIKELMKKQQIDTIGCGHGVCEYMGATHSSQHTAPDAKHSSTCCCPTHEVWELPTPLIVANRSQQGDEGDGSYPLGL
ncbi:hypothetical protein F511_35567 [Dorcoceras hygrometricum]|uniref:Uncharacterized protein n=1 Tax=Dorcoceras hygrometricum TaxID=472368 RepID=A0A2Z7CBP4_9LAMI|nr:hypothetical protein F511_35567 [Dorcoceras hygrometricum]